jgi:hypothetical protein
MRKLLLTPLVAALLLTSIDVVYARDAARDLSKMKGYTIVDAAAVSKVVNGKSGSKVLLLDNKTAFEVDFLFLDPLPLTDVIIFAKPLPKELREKFKNLPEQFLWQYKLLIDNEALDARPLR